jgi:hypothetical protein
MRTLALIAATSAGALAQTTQFAQDQNRTVPSVLPPPGFNAIYAFFEIGDLDGDGLGDVVAARRSSIQVPSLSLWLQQPGGSWTQRALPVGIGSAVTLHDLDGDGDLDLVVGGSQAQQPTPFHVLENDGSANFTARGPWTFLVNSTFERIAPGDFDGDGDDDLLCGTSPAGSSTIPAPYLRYYRNDGTGNFTPSTSAVPVVDTPGCRPIAADFDGDGDLDAFVARTAQAPLYLRNASGWFTPVAAAVPAGATGYVAATADDADGDGDLDVLATSGSRVDLLRSGGNGSFTLVAGVIPGSAAQLRCGDFDGDGDQDAATAAGAAVAVHYNDGTGAFSAAPVLALGPLVTALGSGRIDADAIDDLLTALAEPQQRVVFHQGLPSRVVTDPQLQRGLQPTISASGPALAHDFDGDGLEDLVVTSGLTTPSPIAVLTNRGQRGFVEQPVGAAPFSIQSLHLADLDTDGDQDVVAHTQDTFGAGAMRWYQNRGGAGWSDLGSPMIFPRLVAFADVDADGDDDLVAAQQGSILLYRNTGPGISTVGTTLPGSGLGGYPHALVIADVDGDGDPDVLTGRGSPCMNLLLNDGTGTFVLAAACAFPWPTMPSGMTGGDVDGDGDFDVVLYDVNGPRLFANDGTGVFADVTATQLPPWTPGGPAHHIQGLQLFDADSDRDLDLLQLRAGSELLYLNDGSGTFADATAARWGADPMLSHHRGVAIDLDGDGDREVVADQVIAWNHVRQLSTTAVPLAGGALSLQLAVEPGFAAPGGLALVAIGFVPRPPLAVPASPQ